MNRRTLLRASGGAALTLVGGIAFRAYDQDALGLRHGPGLEAWDDWNDRRYTGELAVVAAGLLAASPHNTQPWQFGIGHFGVDIFEVSARTLGAMDPFGRERLLGLGAAIHNMGLATTLLPRPAVVKLLPDEGNPQHMARIELGPTGQGLVPHPLLEAIGYRHTDRAAYTGEPVPPAQLAVLGRTSRTPRVRVALFPAGSPRGKAFAALTVRATESIIADPPMMAASHAWFRHSRADMDQFKDGLSIRTSGVSPWLAAAGAMLPEQTAADEGKYWLSGTRDTALPTASAFGLVLVEDLYDRRSTLEAGGVWQRLQLTAAALGVASQPLNQFVEMIDRERQLGRSPGFARAADALLDNPAWRPTFAFRLGVSGEEAPPSPRRPVSEVLGGSARLAFEIEKARQETEEGGVSPPAFP